MEKFNPNSSEYKKVEDLPIEVRKFYENISDEDGGGFVRKSAVPGEYGYNSDKAKRDLDKINQEKGVFAKFENFISTIIDKQKEGREIKQLIIEHLMQEVGEHSEIINSAEALIDNYIAKKRDEEVLLMYEQGRKNLEKLGYSGFIERGRCESSGNGCQFIRGFIDGKKINLHTEISSNIGDEELNVKEAMPFFNKFWSAALDKRDLNEVNLFHTKLNRIEKSLKDFILGEDGIEGEDNFMSEMGNEQRVLLEKARAHSIEQHTAQKDIQLSKKQDEEEARKAILDNLL